MIQTARVCSLCLSFAASLVSPCFAQEAEKVAAAAQPADVSGELEPIRAKFDLPALGVMVIRGDEVLASGICGVRAKGDATLATLEDRWHLGSCTKSMTATLCAMLVEEGKMKWTSTLGEVFPERREVFGDAWAGVTLEQLLSHTAGAPADLSKDGLWGQLWKREGTPTAQRLQLLDGVVKRPPLSKPGEAFLYSNAGVAMAGAMAERVTGQGWEELIQARLFTPLGITTAGFGAPGTADVVDEPRGHDGKGRAVKPGPQADNPTAIGPAGTVHMSLRDWARYVTMHMHGERPAAEGAPARLVSPESMKELHRPRLSDYALGWGVPKREWGGGDGRVFTHSGSNTMWFCVVWVSPNKDMAVLAVTNKGGDKATKGTDAAVAAMVLKYVAGAPVLP